MRTFRTANVRFLVVFLACFLLGFAILQAPLFRPAIDWFSACLVRLSAGVIRACGGAALIAGSSGTILIHPQSGLGVEMKDGCNGLNVTILLWAAMLAFPAFWLQKVKGVFWGTLAIQLVNVVRFASLYYLIDLSRPLFDFAHEYLWEALIMLDAMVAFAIWVKYSKAKAAA